MFLDGGSTPARRACTRTAERQRLYCHCNLPRRTTDMGMRPLLVMALLAMAPAGVSAQPAAEVQALLTGKAAMGDWRSDAPGVRRRIAPADLPAPYATPSARNGPRIVPQPPSASPHVPRGFRVERLPAELDAPRIVRAAPNGDIFIAETAAGRIRVLRTPGGATRPDPPPNLAL